MRTSGIITSTFQHSELHKKLLNGEPEHLLLAYHLMVCVNSHMSGLYYYPVGFMASETIRTEADIESSLENLESINFLQYDYENSYVWVINMAYEQGGFRSVKDSRRINCFKHIRSLPELKIRENFIKYYGIHSEIPALNSNGGYTGGKRTPTGVYPIQSLKESLGAQIPENQNQEIHDKFPGVNHAK